MKRFYLFILACCCCLCCLKAQNAAFGHGGKATGGGNATPTLVDTYDKLKSALDSSDPKVIVITKNISFAGKSRITCSKSNKTILAKKGVVLETTGFESKTSGVFLFKGCSNIILRNVKMEGPGADDNQCQDLLNLDGATNVWVDHCEFSDGVDGNFDIIGNSDNITVSWCRFFYEKTPKVAHQFSNLIASNATMKPSDGRYTITFAYNWWDHGCAQRMTRSRNSDLHFVSNYWNSNNASYYIGPGTSALYIEGCYFDGNVETKNIIKDAYEGNNSWTIVDSYAKKGLPSNKGSVSKPSYDCTVIPYKDVPARITDATCGAGATLIVNEDGSVSSPCDSERPSLTLTSGKKDQTLTEGTAISPIVFTAGGSATSINATALPQGVSATKNGLTLTLSGTPTKTATYTVTASDGKQDVKLTGTITVKSASTGGGGGSAEVGDQLCVDLTTGAMPSVDGVEIQIVNDGTGAKATAWESTGMKLNTNKAGISFDLSALNKTLISVSFDVEIPNWTTEKNTLAYGFEAGSTTESYTLPDNSLTTITVDVPAGTTGFTIVRTAGTGTYISKVCFGFEADGNQGGNEGGNSGGNENVTTSDWWNFSDADFASLGTITSSTTVRGLTILATTEKSVIVDANVKNVDGIDFTSRMKLSGTGAADARTLTFPVKGACDIDVYLVSSTSTEVRALNIAAGSFGNVVGTLEAPTAVTKATHRYEGSATTIFLYSPKSGVNIYGIRLTYNGASTDLNQSKTLDVYHYADMIFNPSRQSLALYNAAGQLMETTTENISLAKYTRGFYFISIANGEQTLKIVK